MYSCIEFLREYSRLIYGDGTIAGAINCTSLHVSHYSSCQRRGWGFTAYSDTPSRRCGVKSSPPGFRLLGGGLGGR